MSKEALRLADALDELDRQFSRNGLCGDAAAELRRLALKQWVGLTDQEINSVCYKRDWTAPWTNTTFARAIEAKLREKNGGEYRNGATTERTKLNQENT